MELPTSPAQEQAKAGVHVYVLMRVVAYLALPLMLAAAAAWLYFAA